jgi:integral membrane protein (TIGR01906 family)
MTELNEQLPDSESQTKTGGEAEGNDEQTAAITKNDLESRVGYKWLSWLVTILAPIALVLTTVRLVMTPVFVNLEYHTPNFPADPYGFTQQDRLYWSRIALDYLLNDEGIEYLGDLRFLDGSAVYNERELKHMLDVKNVAQDALIVWYISLAAIFILAIWAWFGNWKHAYSEGLRRGGWLTLILVGAIIVVVLIGFGLFFVAFHDVFFDPGTWRFAFSDTLIRLFPERFWRDTFLTVGLLTGVGALTLVIIFKRKPVG